MKNVLLVDDDSVFNFLNTKTLERMGIARDIQTAMNGEQAMDLFNGYYKGAGCLPDIVLLDLNMPIMNGLECIKALRNARLHPHMKVMMVTTEADNHFIAKALDSGADEFLMKPFTPESLREKMMLLGFAA